MASPAGQGEAREKPQWSHPQIHSQTYTDAHIPAHTHTYTLMQCVLSHTCFPTHIHIHACVLTPTHIRRPIGGSFNSTPNLLQRLQHSSLAALVQTGPRKEGDLALLPHQPSFPSQEGKYAGSGSPPVPSQLPDSPPAVWEHSQAPQGSPLTPGRTAKPHNALQPTPSCPHRLWLDCLCP